MSLWWFLLLVGPPALTAGVFAWIGWRADRETRRQICDGYYDRRRNTRI